MSAGQGYQPDENEILAKGGQEVPLEIHPATTVIRRRGWAMTEEVVPAFVKISTAFKIELADVDANSLKVWLFLALSINRDSEEAHPGVRTIAEGCGLAPNTVTAAVRRLELLGLLTVARGDRTYNIYSIPEFVSANTKPVAKIATPAETVSISDGTVAIKSASVAKLLRRNQRNQSQPELSTQQKFKKPDFVNLTVSQAASIPEIRIYHETTGIIPGSGQWETVWTVICAMNGKGTLEYLRPFWLAWNSKGFRPNNLGWLTEWAVSGEIPSFSKSTNGQTKESFAEKLARA